MSKRLAVAVLAAACLPGPAAASQLIDRDTEDPRLEVARDGTAMVTYEANGRLRHVLAWGAVNAVASDSARPQVAFKLDYSGGWGAFRRPVWKTLRDACRPYDGPALAWLVAACKAPDGSFWALQSWQRTLPNYGGIAAPSELRLSHWTGELPSLEIRFGWTYRRYQQIYGTFTYRSSPVYGFSSTPLGVPLDRFGRNIYLDTYGSAYGPGWRRENAFLSHIGTGGFCYGFYPHGERPSGRGERYRATAIGPGVTPDVIWESAAPSEYDATFDKLADGDLLVLLRGDPLCKPR